MRSLIIIAAILLSGCSTLGDLEVMNDVGLGEVSEAMRAYNKTMNVLGAGQSGPRLNTSAINSGYGNAKQMPDHMNDIPTAVAEIQDLLRYVPK